MGGEDVEAEGLREMVEAVAARYPVDRARVRLTGMSDGATYALLGGHELPHTIGRLGFETSPAPRALDQRRGGR